MCPASLRICTWNSNNITNKVVELRRFLSQEKIDVMVIQETWLRPPKDFIFHGYSVFRTDRVGQRGGGLMTLINCTLPATAIPVPIHITERMGSTELLIVKISDGNKTLLIQNLYNPPSNTNCDLHALLSSSGNNSIIAGDFNAKLVEWGSATDNQFGKDLQEALTLSSYHLISDEECQPTCFPWNGGRPSRTDHILISSNSLWWSDTITADSMGSDHAPLISDINGPSLPSRCISPYHRKPRWIWDKANWNKYQQMTNTISDIDADLPLKEFLLQMNATISQATKACIPMAKSHRKYPFWSKKLQWLTDNRKEALNRYKADPSPNNRTTLNKWSALVKRTSTHDRRQHWRNRIACISTSKSLFQTTRMISNLSTSPTAPITWKNTTARTPKTQAGLFASFFQHREYRSQENAVSGKWKTRVKEKMKNDSPLNDPQNVDHLLSAPIDMQEVVAAQKAISPGRASGPDGINPNLLIHLSQTAIKGVVNLFNKIWNTSTLPDSWKNALIVPIPKKNKSQNSPESFRPISLTSTWCKWLERILLNRLLYWCEVKRVRSSNQGGAKAQHNTQDLLITLVHHIERGFQTQPHGMSTLAIFVDFQQAYDTVQHADVIYRCLDIGIKGLMIKWIHNFLSGRSFRIKWKGCLSKSMTLKTGIPQGSCLSPLLFTFLMDELDQVTPHGVSSLVYMDDIAYLTSSRSPSQLQYTGQEVLAQLETWAKRRHMIVNTQKTEFMVFSLNHQVTINGDPLELHFAGQPIRQTNTFTYLGFTLDKRLTWKTHISKVITATAHRAWMVKRIAGRNWGLRSEQLRRLYISWIRPSLEYGGPIVVSLASETQQKRLFAAQTRTLRSLHNLPTATSGEALEWQLQVTPLKMRLQRQAATNIQRGFRLPDSHPLKRSLEESQITSESAPRLKRRNLLAQGAMLCTGLVPELLNRAKEPLPPPYTNPIEDWSWLSLSTSIMRTVDDLNQAYSPDLYLHCYTDASKVPNQQQAGAGIILFGKGGVVLTETSTKEDHLWAIADLETKAITRAIQHTRLLQWQNQDLSQIKNMVIFTDSRSSVIRLKSATTSPNHKSTLCRLLLAAAKDCIQDTAIPIITITIQWIPGHKGIPGNERADALAKIAEESRPILSTHYEAIQTTLKSRTHLLWQQKTLASRSHTAKSAATWRHQAFHQLPKPHQQIILRLRLKIFPTRAHLFKLRKATSPLCNCGLRETIHHLLRTCPQHQDIRRQIFPLRPTLNLHNMLYGQLPELQATISFLSQIGRI